MAAFSAQQACEQVLSEITLHIRLFSLSPNFNALF